MWVRRGGERSRDPQSWAQPRKLELSFPVPGGGGAQRSQSGDAGGGHTWPALHGLRLQTEGSRRLVCLKLSEDLG